MKPKVTPRLSGTRKKIVEVINKVTDEDLLVHFYEMLQARISDNGDKDIIDELSRSQRQKLVSSLKRLDRGQHLSNEVATKFLKMV